MHRFFISPDRILNGQVDFPIEIAHQVSRVLRLLPGQTVTVLDNLGNSYAVELVQVTTQQVLGQITSRQASGGEPCISIGMYLCLSQREKFEWMLQKCTEVGAQSFTPVISSRSLVQDAGDIERKRGRWESILREAAEQASRGRIPILHPAMKFAEATVVAAHHSRVGLLLWEGERSTRLDRALQGWQTTGEKQDGVDVAVFTGPEGGFSDEEAALARQNGLVTVSLGKRILRMETAAIVAAALILHETGNL